MGDDATKLNRTLLNLAAFVVIVAGMRASSSLLVPFLLACFLAILCATPLRWLTDHYVPRVAAVLLVVIVLLAIGTVIGGILGTTLVDFTRSIPRYEADFQAQLVAIETFLERFGVESSRQIISDYFDPSRLLTVLRDTVTNLGQVLTNGFLIILVMVFILLEMSGFPTKVRAAFGEHDATQAQAGFQKVGTAVRRYVALKTVISLGTGVGVAAWLAILGVDYPILWGVVAFLLNYIPNIGSLIAAIPGVLVAWLELGLGTALVAAVGYLVINVIMANLIEPRVMGYSVGLSTLVVFCSLVFWGWVLGPVGMLLCVPLTVIFRIILETNESTRWLAIMLGSDRSLELAMASGESDITVPSGSSGDLQTS
ncbi:MAG: AI-2E family transporter [Gemmatimonadota bacterium]|nr:AI-2E family transporter [Gemmatimonadota bacterium]